MPSIKIVTAPFYLSPNPCYAINVLNADKNDHAIAPRVTRRGCELEEGLLDLALLGMQDRPAVPPPLKSKAFDAAWQ